MRSSLLELQLADTPARSRHGSVTMRMMNFRVEEHGPKVESCVVQRATLHDSTAGG